MTPAWIETVFPGDHVLIAGAQGTQHDSHIKVITLDKKQQLSQLVSTYEFDRMRIVFAPSSLMTSASSRWSAAVRALPLYRRS